MKNQELILKVALKENGVVEVGVLVHYGKCMMRK